MFKIIDCFLHKNHELLQRESLVYIVSKTRMV